MATADVSRIPVPEGQSISALEELLACPACDAARIGSSNGGRAMSCAHCGLEFPVFNCGNDRIPWLFAEPSSTRLEWKARYNGFLQSNSLELEHLRRARDDPHGTDIGRDRISRLLQGREKHRHQVSAILAPLELEGIDWPADATKLLHGKLPASQGFASYTSNIFRDWAWDNGENEAMLGAIDQVLSAANVSDLGTVLTMGGGACRLPYDMHRRYAPETSVVLDLNPLLMNIASRVIRGESVSLMEFPIAPLDAASTAVCQQLAAPTPLDTDRFLFLLGDASNPPFARGSFDTVVTPWLIDILPHDLREFVPQINRCLARGGLWLNTGSLAFFHADACCRYSEEEVLAIVEDSGFEILSAERQRVQYLQSPHSAHGRVERILSFAARKIADVDAPTKRPYLPDWIMDPSLPVPPSTEAAMSSSHHLLQAQVLGLIDGKRTGKQISRTVARQYGLGQRETMHAVRRILVDFWEKISRGRSSADL